MKKLTQQYDVVVCGGGLAGLCAAVASARHGAKTVLIHDRPVLGGNCSSEVRVPPHGAAAFHAYGRETGIISELLIEERARNHESTFENGCLNSVWDMVMYDLAVRTPNLTLLLNTTVVDIVMADGSRGINMPPTVTAGYAHRAACVQSDRISSVIAHVSQAETEIEIRGTQFVDCTGDAIVADLAGCEWRMGTEGQGEFNEPHAPEQSSLDTMGNSIHFRARDMGRPVPFTPPEWAVKHENPDFFYKQGRVPYDVRGGFWWIEIGIPWNTIYDNETIRHELTRHTLGIWDWMKNRDPEVKIKAANWALDWIGQVPGKRESRRVIGKYFMTEHDPANKTVFEDEIAFGGWFIDLHTPGGLLAPTSEAASAEGYSETSEYAIKSYAGPYGIPLRALQSKDIQNLSFAGRNISTTHAAMGTTRVMGTTALMGQALGTALALELKGGYSIQALQQALLRDGCFLPNTRNEDALDLAKSATATASSEALQFGVGPESNIDVGTGGWSRPGLTYSSNRLGQLMAIGSPEIRTVSVCLTNTSSDVQSAELRLILVDHIWDYRAETGNTLATGVVSVPPGEKQWVEWPVNLTNAPVGRFSRIDLMPNPNIVWVDSPAIEPGHVAMYEMGRNKMRRYKAGAALSFRVSPPQPSYGPANVLSGVTRPHRFTNLWRSDVRQPLPQWLQLAWPQAQTIREIQLSFPGSLLREYHSYKPFFRDPQCPAEYSVEAWVDGAWQELQRVVGNYQRQRRHILDKPATTDKLRVVIHATNGDRCAAIYEVRCYA